MNDAHKERAKKLVRKYGPTVVATYILTKKFEGWKFNRGTEVAIPGKVIDAIRAGVSVELHNKSGDVFVLHHK